jgi:hypothetical protein
MKSCPADCMLQVMVQISDYRAAINCCSVCKRWNWIARQNSVWNELCLRLWSDKVYVPEKYRMLLAHGKAREALIGSVLDSKRTNITWGEFLFQPFYFRFKKNAGSYFTDLDPFWQENEALRMTFSKDGPVIGRPDFKWTFVDGLCGGSGTFLNVTAGDVCLVSYLVTRHSNWGFIIQVTALHDFILIDAAICSK